MFLTSDTRKAKPADRDSTDYWYAAGVVKRERVTAWPGG
jgi:hypothetical protein